MLNFLHNSRDGYIYEYINIKSILYRRVKYVIIQWSVDEALLQHYNDTETDTYETVTCIAKVTIFKSTDLQTFTCYK